MGEKLTTLLVHMKLSKYEFMFALLIFFTILGALVESLGMIVITVPLLYPVLLNYGIDPIWFGIILVGCRARCHSLSPADVRHAGPAGRVAGDRALAAPAHDREVAQAFGWISFKARRPGNAP